VGLVVTVSETNIQQRRQQLRRQRQRKLLHSLWQMVVLSSMAGGLVGLAHSPLWVIHQPEQVTIQGNQILSHKGLKSLLPLSYPKALLTLEPQVMAWKLAQEPTIADAIVTRYFFPPRLIVQVRERQPVAIAYAAPHTLVGQGRHAVTAGLLDAEGVWIPLETYKTLARDWIAPKLSVTGMRNMYRRHWKTLYQAIQQSPIQVQAIVWDDPANLILKTGVGTIHLGPFVASRITAQLTALDQMRHLVTQYPHPINYINLRNPGAPALQLQPETLGEELDTPVGELGA